MVRAASFADKSERLANNGNKALADKQNRIIEHATRVQKLNNRVANDAQRKDALDRIWASYREVQKQIEMGLPEYRDWHLRMDYDDYLASFE